MRSMQSISSASASLSLSLSCYEKLTTARLLQERGAFFSTDPTAHSVPTLLSCLLLLAVFASHSHI